MTWPNRNIRLGNSIPRAPGNRLGRGGLLQDQLLDFIAESLGSENFFLVADTPA